MNAETLSKPSREELLEQIRKFLASVRVLTLATTGEHGPWACTLAYAFDDDLNLYCITNKETRHVHEIATHASVAVALHEHQSPTYNPKTVRGLQIEASADLLSGEEVSSALEVFIGRFPLAEAMSRERLFELKTARIIKIIPRRLYFLDRANIGPRVEIDLT